MSELAEMIARTAQPGRVTWIGLRSERRAPLQAVEVARIETDGLSGDHGRAGKRAVTLVQNEHCAAIGAYLGRAPVAPEDLRRNLVIAGINLASLKGRAVRVGGAVLRITVVCAPCSRMEETFGPGGYAAVRGHGGWCAEVLEPGRVALGDPVFPAD
ncbi:MOSC domain-containing protein [Roseivivax marinus]|uniref:MOSC domain-containing protein n=1 Tax=Roseivivax marinus TaxID=1379903 RepID=UPI00273E7CB8|nr:MOSC domain-containing protein [Roseivivax marinus]